MPIRQKVDDLKSTIAKLEENLAKVTAEVQTLRTQKGFTDKRDDKRDDDLKPLTAKDIKAPTEYGGTRTELLPWHESLTTLLCCRSPN